MKPITILSTLCLTGLVSLSMAQTPATMTPATPPMEAGTVSNPREPSTENDQTLNEADRTMVMQMAVGGMFEVQSSQAALKQGQADQVKQFAQQMITDHTAADNKLKALARDKHVAVPTTLDAKHAKMLEVVKGKQGPQFDKAYGTAQRMAHQEAIALFTKASKDAADKDLKKFAAETLPLLQQHVEKAKSLPELNKEEMQQMMNDLGQRAADHTKEAPNQAAGVAAHAARQPGSPADNAMRNATDSAVAAPSDTE